MQPSPSSYFAANNRAKENSRLAPARAALVEKPLGSITRGPLLEAPRRPFIYPSLYVACSLGARRHKGSSRVFIRRVVLPAPLGPHWEAVGLRQCASFPSSLDPTAIAILRVEWLCAQERWNAEVVIIFGAAARYRRATVGSSHDDAHPVNLPFTHGGGSPPQAL
jgi:hypothetical protein